MAVIGSQCHGILDASVESTPCFTRLRASVCVGIVDAKVGDWVLVHAGLVIQVLPKDEADYMINLFNELEDLQ